MDFERVIAFFVGAALVLAILIDIFFTVVVPRRAPTLGRQLRLSSMFIPSAWKVWKHFGMRLSNSDRREGFLGLFGALAVVMLLNGWVTLLILGYGSLLFALREEMRPAPDSLGSAVYFAGVSLLTLGFGDIVATDWPARVISLVAAGNGLGLFAMVISLLFTLYGSFQRREAAVVVLEAGAGAPPSGVVLLETYAHAGILDDLPKVFADWQVWSAEILDSHLAYPVLAYFRSSHDNDSWVSSLGAVMDAATLVLTTIDGGPKGWAKLFRAVGGHCLEDLVYMFRLEDMRELGVERSEFEAARLALQRAGYRLLDEEQSWEDFSRLRLEYAGRVNALARHWATPPAQWIGDRSPLRGTQLHREQTRVEVSSEGYVPR